MIPLKTRHNPYKDLQRNSTIRKNVYRYNETTTTKINSFTGSSPKNFQFQQQLYDSIYFQCVIFIFYFLHVIR